MGTLAERIYARVPVFAQNAMLSLYGLHLYRQRYHGVFRQRLAELLESERFPAERLRSLQERRLARLVDRAYERVPYYRDLMKQRGIHPRDVTLDNLGELLPAIGKADINREPGRFLADDVPRKGLVRINTSGTSGSPLAFYTTRASLQENYAFFSRFLRWAGVRERIRSATFAGRIFIPKDQDRPPFWRKNLVMRNELFSSYHLSPQNLPHYVAELERLAPEYIDTYPSALYTLARFVRDQGIAFRHRPKAIITSSETLLDHQREAIETVFGCRVFDFYGNAEAVSFIGQCEHGSHHSHPEYGVIEVIGADGKPVPPGAEGELVCTGFLNEAMPLIRYRIGDSAVLSGEPCPCGRNFPVVKQIVGRMDDIIVTPEGNRVGRLDPIFKGLTSIKETQIVQETRERLTMNIVPDKGFHPGMADALVGELRKRVGHTIKVDVQILDSIPRTKAGKFKAVVSRVKD